MKRVELKEVDQARRFVSNIHIFTRDYTVYIGISA